MKLTHLILLAFVSVTLAASPNEIDDTEDLMLDDEKSPAVYFPGVFVDDEMTDDDVMPDLTRTACTCAGRPYDDGFITASINYANRLNPNPVRSGGPYPHRFNNREGLPFNACRSRLIEFPLLQTHVYQPGDNPGTDRVVYSVVRRNNRSVLKFCGCMTHQGARRQNDFVKCR